MEEVQLRPLSSAKVGESVRIAKINGGRGLNSRLSSMGILPNTVVKVVSNNSWGPFVLDVRDSKVMLGRGAASKIMIV